MVVPFTAGGGQRGRGAAAGGGGGGAAAARNRGGEEVKLDVAGQTLTKQALVRERIR